MPLAIRSSAHGDCRGTGIYESKFCEEIFDAERRLKEFCYCIKDVLASHFSSQAVAFRKRCGLPDGIACMVEPLFGRQRLERNYDDEYELVFAPHFSGTAYTSTASGKGEAYIVAGLPLRAVNGEGMALYETDTQALHEILDYNRPSMFSTSKPERNTKYINEEDYVSLGKREKRTDFPARDGSNIFFKPPSWLFSRLRKLEQALGKPHYVEWAVVEREGKLDLAILQIAPIEGKKDFFAFADKENSVVRSTLEVIGSGEVVCDSAVLIYDSRALHLLAEYNRTHKNYLVFYSSMLITSLATHLGGRLDFSHVSNASATVSLVGAKYGASIRSHFGGAGESAGMLMIATGVDGFQNHGAYMLKERGHPVDNKDEEYAMFYEIPVKFLVQADEKQRKAVVQMLEG